MGVLRVMSGHGDDRFTWDVHGVEEHDPEALAAVREAEQIFREQRSRGATAFRAEKGRVPTRIDEFDPSLEQIVLVPPVVGG